MDNAVDIRLLAYEHADLGRMYGFLIHNKARGRTFAVDVGNDSVYLAALEAEGWQLDSILLTHHHDDHVARAGALKAQTGATIRGPKGLKDVDEALSPGYLADLDVEVIATPGHTRDMLNYYLPSARAYFAGDTLFTLGCGRLFEGTPEMMFDSLQKIKALPPETAIYGAHEWTLTHLEFALSQFPDHAPLRQREPLIRAICAKGAPTIPSLLQDELQTNPFLLAKNVQEFARLRATKDAF